MSLKTFKPYTKSSRGTILVDRSKVWKGKPYKPLTSVKYSSSGRNNQGRITARNIGGGHKQKYRTIDFYRKKKGSMAEVERVEYDPNRSCHIMLVKFEDGEKYYYLAPQGIKIGDKISNGGDSEIKVGNCLPLSEIPVGIDIHNVEINPGGGGKIARSAGTSVSISGTDGNYSIIKMTSGEVRKIDSRSLATIGVLSNPDQKNIKIGKAGRSRWLGRRPHTRGVVMNPVDHPHGGGEGKSAGGRHPVSRTGQSAKGLKTRDNKRTDKFIIRRRKKKKGYFMARSVWKGPFVEESLIKKAEKQKNETNKKPIKTWSRKSTIIPDFIGLSFLIYNGKKFIPLTISEDMVGHKFGEFAPTRQFFGHTPADKKAKEEDTKDKK